MGKHVVSEAEITVAELVDLALAGEPVTILRDGRPVAAISAVPAPEPVEADRRAAVRAILQEVRARRPPVNVDVTSLIREMRDEGN